MFTLDWFASLGSVLVIDLVLSGDNAIVIGLAAAGLPPEQRRRAIVIGIAAATVLRIAFALFTFHLLAIIGLTLAGGLLLLWVCWKMWREIRAGRHAGPDPGEVPGAKGAPPRTFGRALVSIVAADVSMALDNVLAVAGASGEHFEVLVIGLVLSIALMAVASNYVARLLERHHWLAYVGLAIVGIVALEMIWEGSREVLRELGGFGAPS